MVTKFVVISIVILVVLCIIPTQGEDDEGYDNYE